PRRWPSPTRRPAPGRAASARPSESTPAGPGAARSRSREDDVMTPSPRQQLADELLRRFSAALRSSQLYSAGHPIIARNLEGLTTAIQLLHTLEPAIVIGVVGDEIIVDDAPIA